MGKIAYEPTLFDYDEGKERIEGLIKENNPLPAFLLSFSYLESYLLQLLIIRNFKIIKRPLKKKLKDYIERLTFNHILTLNFLLSNISFEEYQRINSIASRRNNFTHNLISINLNSKKVNDKLKHLTLETMKTCKNLFNKILSDLND